MKEKAVSDRIRYIEASRDPLSADIGIVSDEGSFWLYDVGCGDDPLNGLDGEYDVVLSHFHPDHTGNIGKIRFRNLYVSGETLRHLPEETRKRPGIHIVTEPVTVGNIRIFPLPSSHAKGCLGMEVTPGYAFVGDALCCRIGRSGLSYSVQLLKEEIDVLEALSARYLLVSHFSGLVRSRKEVLDELKNIYSGREKGKNEIPVGM